MKPSKRRTTKKTNKPLEDDQPSDVPLNVEVVSSSSSSAPTVDTLDFTGGEVLKLVSCTITNPNTHVSGVSKAHASGYVVKTLEQESVGKLNILGAAITSPVDVNVDGHNLILFTDVAHDRDHGFGRCSKAVLRLDGVVQQKKFNLGGDGIRLMRGLCESKDVPYCYGTRSLLNMTSAITLSKAYFDNIKTDSDSRAAINAVCGHFQHVLSTYPNFKVSAHVARTIRKAYRGVATFFPGFMKVDQQYDEEDGDRAFCCAVSYFILCNCYVSPLALKCIDAKDIAPIITSNALVTNTICSAVLHMMNTRIIEFGSPLWRRFLSYIACYYESPDIVALIMTVLRDGQMLLCCCTPPYAAFMLSNYHSEPEIIKKIVETVNRAALFFVVDAFIMIETFKAVDDVKDFSKAGDITTQRLLDFNVTASNDCGFLGHEAIYGLVICGYDCGYAIAQSLLFGNDSAYRGVVDDMLLSYHETLRRYFQKMDQIGEYYENGLVLIKRMPKSITKDWITTFMDYDVPATYSRTFARAVDQYMADGVAKKIGDTVTSTVRSAAERLLSGEAIVNTEHDTFMSVKPINLDESLAPHAFWSDSDLMSRGDGLRAISKIEIESIEVLLERVCALKMDHFMSKGPLRGFYFSHVIKPEDKQAFLKLERHSALITLIDELTKTSSYLTADLLNVQPSNISTHMYFRSLKEYMEAVMWFNAAWERTRYCHIEYQQMLERNASKADINESLCVEEAEKLAVVFEMLKTNAMKKHAELRSAFTTRRKNLVGRINDIVHEGEKNINRIMNIHKVFGSDKKTAHTQLEKVFKRLQNIDKTIEFNVKESTSSSSSSMPARTTGSTSGLMKMFNSLKTLITTPVFGGLPSTEPTSRDDVDKSISDALKKTGDIMASAPDAREINAAKPSIKSEPIDKDEVLPGSTVTPTPINPSLKKHDEPPTFNNFVPPKFDFNFDLNSYYEAQRQQGHYSDPHRPYVAPSIPDVRFGQIASPHATNTQHQYQFSPSPKPSAFVPPLGAGGKSTSESPQRLISTQSSREPWVFHQMSRPHQSSEQRLFNGGTFSSQPTNTQPFNASSSTPSLSFGMFSDGIRQRAQNRLNTPAYGGSGPPVAGASLPGLERNSADVLMSTVREPGQFLGLEDTLDPDAAQMKQQNPALFYGDKSGEAFRRYKTLKQLQRTSRVIDINTSLSNLVNGYPMNFKLKDDGNAKCTMTGSFVVGGANVTIKEGDKIVALDNNSCINMTAANHARELERAAQEHEIDSSRAGAKRPALKRDRPVSSLSSSLSSSSSSSPPLEVPRYFNFSELK
jgi:hypothetical protein